MAKQSKTVKPDRHRGQSYATRLLPPVAAEMEKLALAQRRSYSNMIEVLVEEALKARRQS